MQFLKNCIYTQAENMHKYAIFWNQKIAYMSKIQKIACMCKIAGFLAQICNFLTQFPFQKHDFCVKTKEFP